MVSIPETQKKMMSWATEMWYLLSGNNPEGNYVYKCINRLYIVYLGTHQQGEVGARLVSLAYSHSYMGNSGRSIISSRGLLEMQNEFKTSLGKSVKICLRIKKN